MTKLTKLSVQLLDPLSGVMNLAVDPHEIYPQVISLVLV